MTNITTRAATATLRSNASLGHIPQNQNMRRLTRLKNNPWMLIGYAVLILNSASCLVPILWTLSNSFRTNTQIFSSFSLVPESLDFSNFESLLLNTNVLSAFGNSFVITVGSLILMLACVLPASFVLARISFPYSKVIYSFFLLSIFVPGIVLLQALYQLFATTGMLNIRFSIILAYAAGHIPFSIFLMISYMREVPLSVEEAAILDGANVWQIFTRVILPISRNGVVTITILGFVAIWNDYIYALVFLPQPDRQTLTVALAAAKSEYAVNYGLLSAAAIMAIVPVLIFYLFTKNMLMSGMSAGAVKG